MLILLQAMLFAIFVAQAAIAADPQPTEESIRELMTLMEGRKLIDDSWRHVESAMQTSMQQALAGQFVTPEQQKILDDMQVKMVALFKDEMKWEILEPIFIDIYQKSFSQQEISGMLTFYRSEPGKATVAKMPLVMQHTMEAMLDRITAMRPKLQQLQRDTLEQLKAAQKP